MKLRYFLLLFIFVPASCALGYAQSASQPAVHHEILQPPVELTNLGTLKTDLTHYHDCVGSASCYRDDVRAQFDRAAAVLIARTRACRPTEKLAIVFDIDETVLSNWTEITEQDFGFNQQASDKWEEKAVAEEIPGAVALYKQALAEGVKVFFITGRREPMRKATEDNLRLRGMTEWEHLSLRPVSDRNASVVPYKSGERRNIVSQSYTIILNVGDQWSDLQGEPEAEVSVKLPNPFYFIP